VQKLELDRGISFPDARKAAISEQSTNTSFKRTAASFVPGSTTETTQRSQKSTISIAIQTKLTWPQETDTPVPVKTNSQTTQPIAMRIVKIEKYHFSCPPPKSNRGANAPIPSTSKNAQGTLNPHRPLHLRKRTANQKINRPSTHR